MIVANQRRGGRGRGVNMKRKRDEEEDIDSSSQEGNKNPPEDNTTVIVPDSQPLASSQPIDPSGNDTAYRLRARREFLRANVADMDRFTKGYYRDLLLNPDIEVLLEEVPAHELTTTSMFSVQRHVIVRKLEGKLLPFFVLITFLFFSVLLYLGQKWRTSSFVLCVSSKRIRTTLRFGPHATTEQKRAVIHHRTTPEIFLTPKRGLLTVRSLYCTRKRHFELSRLRC